MDHTLRFQQAAVPLLLAALLGLAGCASPPSAGNMVAGKPDTTASASVRAAGPVVNGSQSTAAGRPTTVLVTGPSPEFSATLKRAVEDSLANQGRLVSVGSGQPAEYKLTGTVVQLETPFSLAAKTVNLEVAWSITRVQDDTVLLRKVLSSSHTGGAFDSFNGLTRVVMAAEAASRKNIELLLQEISALKL